MIFAGTKLNRSCCSSKHTFFYGLLRSSCSAALSAHSNLEAEVELSSSSPNFCVLQLSIARSSHDLKVNLIAVIDLTGDELRALLEIVSVSPSFNFKAVKVRV